MAKWRNFSSLLAAALFASQGAFAQSLPTPNLGCGYKVNGTTVGCPAAVAVGGTGGATATAARTALGAAASGANTDILSIGGLTTPLSVGQGGSGTTLPSLVAGTSIIITGSWPNQTISATVPAPGGTSGQVQYNNSGAFGGFTVGGDGTLNTATGALVVTKTNGATFASVATSGSASDLSTGTLPLARFGTQTARFVLAGPASGGAVNPTFRQLSSNDLSDGTTGTGNVVLSDAPTFTSLAHGASLTLSSTLTAATVNGTNITATNAVNAAVGSFGTVVATSTAIAVGTITIDADGLGNANMEIGSISVPTTPYIDFHSSGNNIDYDVRIIASGGTGSAGDGSLTAFAAGGFNLNSGGLLLNASATSKNAIDASGQTGFTIANGSSQALPITSGAALALVIDTSTGHTAVYLLAGAPGILISSDSNWVTGTTPGAGNNSVAWNGSAYAVFNNCGTGTHTYKALLFRIA